MNGLHARIPADSEFDLVVLGDCNPDLVLTGAGALAVDNSGQIVAIPGLAGMQPVDAVGAGDSFDAGLLTGLLSGWPVERAVSLGCACGALSTRAVRGTSAQPTLAEALEAVELLNAVGDTE